MNRMITTLIAACSLTACTTTPEILPFPVQSIPAALETEPMTGIGDRADDPAIWVSDDEGQSSLILGTNKEEGLHVYNLSGDEIQFLDVGAINNVDLRGRYGVASNDEQNSLSWFVITRNARTPVLHIGDTPVETVEPYGVCLGQDERGLLAAVTYKTGQVEFWRADQGKDADIVATLERSITLPSQLEGCVFDESQGLIFIGEEAFGIWALSYADASSDPYVVDRVEDANGLVADVEGISIYWAPKGGYLIASAQEADRFVVYDRLPPHKPRGIIAVGPSTDSGVDSVSHTDGLDVVSAALPGFPNGLLVVQDDGNPRSGVDQNFKLVDWTEIIKALELME